MLYSATTIARRASRAADTALADGRAARTSAEACAASRRADDAAHLAAEAIRAPDATHMTERHHRNAIVSADRAREILERWLAIDAECAG